MGKCYDGIVENFSANKSLEPDMTRKKKEPMLTSQNSGEIGVPYIHVMGAEPGSSELALGSLGVFPGLYDG